MHISSENCCFYLKIHYTFFSWMCSLSEIQISIIAMIWNNTYAWSRISKLKLIAVIWQEILPFITFWQLLNKIRYFMFCYTFWTIILIGFHRPVNNYQVQHEVFPVRFSKYFSYCHRLFNKRSGLYWRYWNQYQNSHYIKYTNLNICW